ncbi:uncharacterized protein [Haliotis asinina]|uniref:uncharacterized protein n=1 Tax=Haliotis asinina TaxID=109174 RepID=UPI003531DFE7
MLPVCSKMMSLKTGWILLCLATVSSGFEVCYENDGFKTKTLTCTHSCCGTSSYRYCCGSSSSTVGLVIGIVLGGVVLLALLIGIIVCCICCCKASPGHRGQVVTSGQQLTVISTGPNAVSGAYNAGYVPTVQSPPGTYIQPPVAMAQPPPPYSPPIGSGHPPGPWPGYPPMQGQAHTPMQSPAHPPGPAPPPMTGPARPPGRTQPPVQEQAAPRPPPAGSTAPQMGDISGHTRTDDEHVYTSLQF